MKPLIISLLLFYPVVVDTAYFECKVWMEMPGFKLIEMGRVFLTIPDEVMTCVDWVNG